MRGVIVSLGVISGLFLFSHMARADDVIGSILEVEGSASVLHAGTGQSENAALDTPVYEGDTVTTGGQSRVYIQFIDDTEMVLSENTEFRADAYIFDDQDNTENKAVYNILRGTFQYVSGLIAKKPLPDVTVQTAYGSIGIRGTNFWGGAIDGEYGVYVLDGQVKVKNNGGESLVDQGQGVGIKGNALPPGVAKLWEKGKIDRATATVFLKNRDQIRQRIEERRARQLEQRSALRQKLQIKRNIRQQERKFDKNLEDLKQKLQRKERLEDSPFLKKRLR